MDEDEDKDDEDEMDKLLVANLVVIDEIASRHTHANATDTSAPTQELPPSFAHLPQGLRGHHPAAFNVVG